MVFFRGSPRLGLASNLVCFASASSSLPLPCLALYKDIAALPRLCLDKTALSPSLDVVPLRSDDDDDDDDVCVCQSVPAEKTSVKQVSDVTGETRRRVVNSRNKHSSVAFTHKSNQPFAHAAPPVSLYASLSLSITVCLSLCLSVCLYVCLYVCLSVSLYLFVHLSLSLSVCTHSPL